jgi:hypothetical protein
LEIFWQDILHKKPLVSIGFNLAFGKFILPMKDTKISKIFFYEKNIKNEVFTLPTGR